MIVWHDGDECVELIVRFGEQQAVLVSEDAGEVRQHYAEIGKIALESPHRITAR